MAGMPNVQAPVTMPPGTMPPGTMAPVTMAPVAPAATGTDDLSTADMAVFGNSLLEPLLGASTEAAVKVRAGMTLACNSASG